MDRSEPYRHVAGKHSPDLIFDHAQTCGDLVPTCSADRRRRKPAEIDTRPG